MITNMERQLNVKAKRMHKMLSDDAERWFDISYIRRQIGMPWHLDGMFKQHMIKLVKEDWVQTRTEKKKVQYKAKHGWTGLDDGFGSYLCACECGYRPSLCPKYEEFINL